MNGFFSVQRSDNDASDDPADLFQCVFLLANKCSLSKRKVKKLNVAIF
jgi:hypothetical protein